MHDENAAKKMVCRVVKGNGEELVLESEAD
jgi:hypothetical protein